ncbi:glycosyl hydrolases family 31-domain-containing protein [Kickxella alabastrina]|uniref:glycosyl hydrolases family 31-domain-containing protein n=1 Tax=Kickxella alabastrina TaxID=61397 RepID=UPI00221E9723|nr:glycosyl hydrolases family 31-domain-containing protein [Kickxella alabastrina]KAI7825087.1 glycosyl hydrolases family 31-domain-containing protein [Kickxella alabastrina]
MKLNNSLRTRTSTLFYLAATASLLAKVGQAVNHANFKTCEQSAFARRHRLFADTMAKKAAEPNNKNAKSSSSSADGSTHSASSPYSVIDSSVHLDGHTVTASVQHEQAQVPLHFEIAFLKSGTVRICVQEVDPLVPRYNEAHKHILRDKGSSLPYASPEDIKMATEAVNGLVTHTVSYVNGSSAFSVRMTENPWTLEYLVNGKPTMQLNTSGLFHFEHLRQRPADGNLDDVDGGWEETFNNWTDHKRRGPESFGLDINFYGFEHVYGIPEHTSPLSLKDTRGGGEGAYNQPYRIYNLDVFNYQLDSPMAIYGSLPFMLAHNAEATVGVFWVNSSETWVDVTRKLNRGGSNQQSVVNTHWFSESGTMDVFLLPGPSTADVYRQYLEISEQTPMPREFALGYHQCRWNYEDQEDVLAVSAKFREHSIPYDVIWLDVEYTVGKRYFTWDYDKFPNPLDMQQELARNGHKLVTISDPHIMVDNDYHIWKEGNENGYFIKNIGGLGNYEASCWPGVSSWVDFLDPAASKWMGAQYGLDKFPESTTDMFVWNDMNEPAVFDGPEHTMDKALIQHGGWEHRDVHNLYGMMQQRSTFEGLLAREPIAMRPFLLSRSFYAGSQRYGAIWTGDNTASWGYLRASIPMLLGNNIAGMHFSGADVGGFFGNPDPELLTRWFQLGAWYPFFRGHAHFNTERREPWIFGEPYVSYIRNAIRERYRLLPHWYTLFRETSLTGMPLIRPMWMNFPAEPDLFAEQDTFMVGSSIMVAAITRPDTSIPVDVLFPGEEPWYDMHTHVAYPAQLATQFVVDLANTLVFARGGSIIPTREQQRQSSAYMKRDPFTLYVYVDQAGFAAGKLYIDDGETYDYQSGAFIERELTFLGSKLVSRASPLTKNTSAYQTFVQRMSGINVERIVVVGLAVAHNVTEAVVVENKTTRTVNVSHSHSSKIVAADTISNNSPCIVICNPAVFIGDDWEISF